MTRENRALEPHIVALIHNVQLNKEGWTERGLRGVLLSLLIEDGELSEGELWKQATAVGYNLDSELLRRNLDALVEKDQVSIRDGVYSLTSEARKKLESTIETYLAEEEEVRSIFFEKARVLAPGFDLDSLWKSFHTGFLLPMAQDLGTSVVHLFRKNREPPENLFRSWLTNYAAVNHEDLRELVLDFFDPGPVIVKDYVLRLVDAALVVQASGLTSDDLAALSEDIRPTFTLILDTNFIFSLLGLHSNPANEATDHLYSIRGKIRNFVDVSFVVVPYTIDEAKRALSAARDECAEMHVNPEQAKVLLQTGLAFPGLVRRYLEKTSERRDRFHPEDHFGPYLRTMTKILEKKDVVVVKDDLRTLMGDWFVRKDLDEQRRFFKRIGQDKGDAQIRHDVLLWHYAKRKRGSMAENAVEANYWLLTVDHGLVKFDRHRSKLETAPVPVCVHPTTLLQLLQFWVPRSRQLDVALMQSLRFPLFFSDYDRNEERVTMRLLKTVGSFEVESELPSDILAEFLMDQDLRRRIRDAEGVQEEVEVIENQLMEILAEREKEIEEREKELLEIRREQESWKRREVDMRNSLENAELEVQRRMDESAALEARVAGLTREVAGLHAAEANRLREEESRRVRRKRMGFVGGWFGLPAIALGTLCLGLYRGWFGWAGDHVPFFPLWLWAVGGAGTVLVVLAFVAEQVAVSRPELKDWRGLTILLRVAKGIGGILVAVIVGVFANWLWSMK